MSTRWGPRAVVAVLGAAALLSGCTQQSGHSGEASCAALIEYGGHRYVGFGELVRDPRVTGRVDVATRPACNDGGGPAARAERINVAELADVPVARAVLANGSLYVRADLPIPRAARVWFIAPSCQTAGEFTLGGQWLSVQGPRRIRFDGDIRPPYRVGVHVTSGPHRYVGTTIQIHATRDTAPTLGPHDVRTSLWRGGGLNGTVRCADHRFVATSLSSSRPPG